MNVMVVADRGSNWSTVIFSGGAAGVSENTWFKGDNGSNPEDSMSSLITPWSEFSSTVIPTVSGRPKIVSSLS